MKWKWLKLPQSDDLPIDRCTWCLNPIHLICVARTKHVSTDIFMFDRLFVYVALLLLPFQLRFGHSIGFRLYIVWRNYFMFMIVQVLFWMIGDQTTFYYAQWIQIQIQCLTSNKWLEVCAASTLFFPSYFCCCCCSSTWNMFESWLFSSQLFLFRDFVLFFFARFVLMCKGEKRDMETWAEVKFFGCLLRQVTKCGIFFFLSFFHLISVRSCQEYIVSLQLQVIVYNIFVFK